MSENCREVVETLYLFLDGELSAPQRASIQSHLDGCPPCYDAFEFEYELWQVVAVRCREQVPESLKLRIQETLRIDIPPTSTGIDPL